MENFLSKWKLSQEKLPKHLAIIMDGNGRWATKRFLPRLMGHRQGVERVREITELCGKIGVFSLSLYAFSEENWNRPDEEISGLMSLLRNFISSERETLLKNKVVFRILGDKSRLPQDIFTNCEDLENLSKANTGLHLNIALSYGGQSEIVRASKKLCADVINNVVDLDAVTPALFSNYLDTSFLPPVDLMIRTSGEQRISNFLLWQAAYAELFFESVLWPDFTADILGRIFQEFSMRERRFGLTSAQVRKA